MGWRLMDLVRGRQISNQSSPGAENACNSSDSMLTASCSNNSPEEGGTEEGGSEMPSIHRFERKCPPGGEGRVVFYSTTLRGVRKTFADCQKMRAILESFPVRIDERDVSMDFEFRQELKQMIGSSNRSPVLIPSLFIRGRYIGGLQEVTQLHENGALAGLMRGLPHRKCGEPCAGCGGARFLPCSECSGRSKIFDRKGAVTFCRDCNENGLMRCPICY